MRGDERGGYYTTAAKKQRRKQFVPGRDVDLLSVLIQILEHGHQNTATERLQIPVSKLLQCSKRQTKPNTLNK
jgi:hypothetical protein